MCSRAHYMLLWVYRKTWIKRKCTEVIHWKVGHLELNKSIVPYDIWPCSDIFDFVLTFADIPTIDTIVVPVLNHFIENIYIYNIEIWDVMEESFGEDRHTSNQSPVFISFATIQSGSHGERKCTVNMRLLTYNNLKDGRPWGLDIFWCWNVQCQAPAYNMIFHVHGKQWVETKIKYTCLQCCMIQKGIPCSSWIHAVRSQKYGRVWYQWPLSVAQQCKIGIIQ